VKVQDRVSEIRGIIYSHCNDIIDQSASSTFEINQSKKRSDFGTISIEIKCLDGSLLNFFEKLNNGVIEIYSYEYIRPDTSFFYHYQNEGVENGIKKPLHHLHVGIKKDTNEKLWKLLPKELKEHGGPHYKVSEISFNEFMGMIIVNFFKYHRNLDNMLINLGF
jgi:hypothetical protein